MKLSERTLEVLKNFSMINNGLVINEPNCIKTGTISNSTIGVFDCEETFDKEIGIYDLAGLLNAIQLLNPKEVELEIEDDKIILKNDKGKVKLVYRLTDTDIIKNPAKEKPSEKFKSFDKFTGWFELSEETLKQIKRMSKSMNFDMMEVSLKDGKGTLKLTNSNNPLSNSAEYEIDGEGDGYGKTYTDLIVIDGNYKIHICEGMMFKFDHQEIPLIYFIAMVNE